MPGPAIGIDADKPADILGHLAPEVAFGPVLGLQQVGDLGDFIVGQIVGLLGAVDAGPGDDVALKGRTDAIDVAQGVLHALATGNINTKNTRHTCVSP